MALPNTAPTALPFNSAYTQPWLAVTLAQREHEMEVPLEVVHAPPLVHAQPLPLPQEPQQTQDGHFDDE